MNMRALVKMTALAAFLAATPALAVKYVAVVETGIDEASGASADINPAEVRQITAELRRQATENLPTGKYNVITSETILSMGGAVLEDCSEENCVVTLGSKIGADFIVRGTISKFKTRFTLTVELYETENGTLVVTSEPVRSEDIVDLLDRSTAASANMYKKFAESQNSIQKPVPTVIDTAVIERSRNVAVAVYMAGQEPPTAKGVHTIMGGELARVLSESDRYTAVDRTEAILEQLDKEHVYQRSGAVDDDQIKAIGHQLGVGFLCISNINAVGRKYYLDTRLVDVVTAEIARSVTATSNLKDANEMTRVGRNIALELLEAEKTAKQRKLKKKIFRYTAIGLDVLGAGALAYGYLENSNVVKHKESVGTDEEGRNIMADGPEAERAATRRNVGYIIGGTLLAAGVTIHIVF